MKVSKENEFLIHIAAELQATIKARDSFMQEYPHDDPIFLRGKIAALAQILDKAQELGLPVASAQYLAGGIGDK